MRRFLTYLNSIKTKLIVSFLVITLTPLIYISYTMLNNATDTVLQTVPKMVLALSDVKLNNDKISGAPYYEVETSFTEKKFNPDKGNYEYEPGNSYNVKR